MSEWGGLITGVISAIIGLAIVSVIISKNAQAPQVIQAGTTGLADLIKAATGPVTTSNQFFQGGAL